MRKNNIAIFASGSGTNAENLANYFEAHPSICVREILSNNKEAFVHERAKKLGLPSSNFTRQDFKQPSFVEKLQKIDFIVLAGFLWLIPQYLIQAFPERIINIHPALLPNYGGKGMYGSHVHQAVIEASEKESGITIHLVNEEYDQGEVLFQAKCEVEKSDTKEKLAEKIHQLEHKHFPKVVEDYILKKS